MEGKKVRVRFAPSPTGPLHIGGVRTALYNYLFARQNGGTMILRIEDTDSNRFVPGAEDYINEALAWLGIKIDEGVREGGAYGPYKQSERRDIYRKYTQQLLDATAKLFLLKKKLTCTLKANDIFNRDIWMTGTETVNGRTESFYSSVHNYLSLGITSRFDAK